MAGRLKKAKRKGGFVYFIAAPGAKGVSPGIYERRDLGISGQGVRCVIRFVKGVRYRKRLAFYDVVEASIDATLRTQFDIEMARAAT